MINETPDQAFRVMMTDGTSCPHDKSDQTLHIADKQDAAFISRHPELFDGTTVNRVPLSLWNETRVVYRGVALCDECNAKLPSVKAQAAKRAEQNLSHQERERQNVLDLIEGHHSDPLYLCPDCDTPVPESELVPVRYCPHCEQGFDASDGRNCTECNRPFSRKVSDAGCVDCLSEDNAPVSMSDAEVEKLHDDVR